MTAPSPADRRTGVWLVGMAGNLSTTVVAGARALAAGLVEPTGLLTATPQLAPLDLVAVDDLVFGGHEVRSRSVEASARDLAGKQGFLSTAHVDDLVEDLRAVDQEVRPGTLLGASAVVSALAGDNARRLPDDATGAAAVERLAGDMEAFRAEHGLRRVLVVNAASTEPRPSADLPTPAAVQAALASPDARSLSTSSLYALAALRAGCPYINFTPSPGASPPGIRRMFEDAGVPHAGADGKTGETLVKSALAPLFAIRNLRVLSWTGQNLLGNRDGEVLTDPESREAKVRSKSGLLSGILGYEPEQRVGIDYVRSLGDWKVAWDFVHFEGFLGTPMRLQFVWEGCDSALAAPVLLDLIRLVDRAHERGEAGAIGPLALFFKSPLGCDEHSLTGQMALLLGYLGL